MIGITAFMSCTSIAEKKENSLEKTSPLVGTWKLISGTTIKGNDTITTDYTKNQEMIKIFNESHFSFLRHDLNQGKDSTNTIYVAGGGRYTYKENEYTEYLDYFNIREWENNQFSFEFEISGDTLITRGVEEVKELNVNHINIETLIRVKK